MNKFIGHLKTVCTHKKWVFYYCWKAGITWRGIKHDISKFSPTEFFESVKYYQGDRSPIDACKEANGVSKAWMHHKGRNSHHYEYWQDNFDNGGVSIQLPLYDAIELLCDYLGAGKAYQGKDFTYISELRWWNAKKSNPPAMHQQTINFISLALKDLVEKGDYALDLDNLKDIYFKAEYLFFQNHPFHTS